MIGLVHTLSFWLAGIGATARVRGRRTLAGACWIVLCVGYFGILWERMYGADLRCLRHPRRGHLSPLQIGIHALLGACGLHMLRKDHA